MLLDFGSVSRTSPFASTILSPLQLKLGNMHELCSTICLKRNMPSQWLRSAYTRRFITLVAANFDRQRKDVLTTAKAMIVISNFNRSDEPVQKSRNLICQRATRERKLVILTTSRIKKVHTQRATRERKHIILSFKFSALIADDRKSSHAAALRFVCLLAIRCNE